MSKDMLMKKMMALDFMAVDLALFLDTHRCDDEAIKTYEAIAADAQKAREEYECTFGPISQINGVHNGKWCWADDPWPWQNCANIAFRGEE